MNKKIIVAALASVALMGCQSTSGSSNAAASNDSAYSNLANAALMGAVQAWSSQSGDNTDLLSALQSSADVSSEQAAGGLGSMLALAQNSLSSSETSEMAELIPGFDSLQSTGLTSMIANNETVKSAFSALGMDPSLISTFAPIILSALQSQGASNGLLDSLGAIWQ
ncbi:DUF2780 domain-containing protein [Vibrio brasiliensis]|uniref:DUF2780 domain-containing protein n=1 Tax=Vibrio brasiliensis LMG 20546 TaxID=945543 RepID=E8LRU8_9VIBR|nr:DUF2780 domain-containing protein [Vibrio brasiliensis]EGA66556.1 hypothetical protein VIBR0546_03852 [Vibrio brasiliensis LMG 20546]